MKALTILTVFLSAFMMVSSVIADEPADKPTSAHFTSIDEVMAAAVTNDRAILLDFYATW